MLPICLSLLSLQTNAIPSQITSRFGVVYLEKDETHGETARKVYQKDREVENIYPGHNPPLAIEVFKKELDANKRVQAAGDHDNIAKFFYSKESPFPTLVFKRIRGLELLEYLIQNHPKASSTSCTKFSYQEWKELMKKLFKQMIEVFMWLLKIEISHGDISPENFIIDSTSKKITLIDFDHAIVGSGKQVDYLEGKPGYRPPEVHQYKRHLNPEKADVYMLGATLFTMLVCSNIQSDSISGCQIWNYWSKNGLETYVRNHWKINDEVFPQDALELVEKMVSCKVNDRPTMEEVSQHEYLSDLRDATFSRKDSTQD